MPSWSPDGEWIYFIRDDPSDGHWPVNGGPATCYDLDRPELMRDPGRRQRRAGAAR